MYTEYDERVANEAFANFKIEFDDFLASPRRNQHVDGDDIICVYVRKGVHYIAGQSRKCLDIATIVVCQEFQGHGLGMRVIDYIHGRHPFEVTYVEELINISLYSRLVVDGWLVVDTKPVFKCVYKNKR